MNGNTAVEDSVNNPRHPFGLPPGSVRGFMSILICAFFWMVLLWPGTTAARPLLGHFFLLALVLMAFASSPTAKDAGESFLLPWILRVIFVGISVAVVLYALTKEPGHVSSRLTPDVKEFTDWWSTFLGVMAGGFSLGLILRFGLGRTNPVFYTLRAWLGLVGMIMLVLELALFAAFTSSIEKPEMFFRYWQAIEIVIVSAYFGTRS